MKKRMSVYVCLLAVFLMVSACSNDSEKSAPPIMYNFKEPTSYPFEISEASTEIDIGKPDYLHQFIFTYYNEETTQRLKYIVSKVLGEQEELSKNDKIEYQLKNGVSAYYEETSTSQSLWWERHDGFLARYVYFTDNNRSELGNYKLEIEDFLDLANQVQ
ncbi:hypothetical protein [Thalassobacillus hwangdonensis]|uniref:DUF4367 domain-containing protein n=1 Tax=Thalassobacillus hwangdonensis TaxID=546108 RepID=A0ABW3L0U2_9BACI